jgi:hypothetical protein
MFLCRIFIAPGGVGRAYEDLLTQALQRLADEFPEFHPSIEPANHFVEFRDVDPGAVNKMEAWLNDRDHEYSLGIDEKCSDSELLKARFVPFLIEGEYVDSDRNHNPLNRYREVRCKTCLVPKEDSVPNPFVVSELNSRKVQDVYKAQNGIIIVSQKFLSAIGNKLSGCVHSGEAAVTEAPRTKRLKGPYFWLRPKFSLGREIRSVVRRVCESCGAPIEVRKIQTEDKFLDAQVVLEDFGSQSCDIALSGNWYGERTQERPISVTRDIFISGELCSFLLKQKLKGICSPTNVVVARRGS